MLGRVDDADAIEASRLEPGWRSRPSPRLRGGVGAGAEAEAASPPPGPPRREGAEGAGISLVKEPGLAMHSMKFLRQWGAGIGGGGGAAPHPRRPARAASAEVTAAARTSGGASVKSVAG